MRQAPAAPFRSGGSLRRHAAIRTAHVPSRQPSHGAPARLRAPSSGPNSAMNEFTPPPWKRSNPKGKAKSTPLTDAQKAAAKQRAEEAGRPYPNLVDNMWASRQPK
ncbi:conserved hypothetical protein [Xanthomonas euvesicatoria pv. vesicatoria str. 85-10]|uniref:Uncharacterized protein n=3 Tax=Xanthomonas euvesicatoria TaxID=456327 RepID=Q3BVR3_XANE5|nr:conserved hypothetical protein [Xanthomonas euvesicatoria pv. vesicatoria str. 85-10]